jgi:GT2 family glycosyltransferase
MEDLTICQDCKKEPATYGDGITWSRCAGCQLKHNQAAGVQPIQTQPGSESFPHRIESGLVSVILPVYMVNYTLFHYTGNCIGALREHTPEDFELVVVDNGSPLKPPKLESYYAHKVIVNAENLGVTKAWNQGIRASVGEYIVLLNNDVQVFDGWFETMKYHLADTDLVMAHPMYSLTEPFARAVESKQVLRGKKRFDALEKDFSCVMFKRSLIDEIGLFDERFFNYCSDVDFFKRMDEAGKKYKVLDNVATSHISDATGYSIAETPEIMNKDKEAYKEKWEHKTNVQEAVKEATAITGNNLLRVIDGGDPLYLRAGNSVHRIANPETLKALGFDFGQEQVIEKAEFDKFQKGELISMQNIKKFI